LGGRVETISVNLDKALMIFFLSLTSLTIAFCLFEAPLGYESSSYFYNLLIIKISGGKITIVKNEEFTRRHRIYDGRKPFWARNQY